MSRSSRFRSSLATFVTVSSLASLSAPARGETLLRLEKYEPGQLQMQGFELLRGGKIYIEAVGVRPRWEHELIAYAWILDSRTREPVWEMETDDSERVSGQRLLRKATKTLDLPAGRYEVYAWLPTSMASTGTRTASSASISPTMATGAATRAESKKPSMIAT